MDVFGAKKCGKRRNLKKTLKVTNSRQGDGVMKREVQGDGLYSERFYMLNGCELVTASQKAITTKNMAA